MKTQLIKIADLSANYGTNVRFSDNYGDVSELADNIQAKGLLVPLSVEPLDGADLNEDGEGVNGSGGANGTSGAKFGIISGHRRYAALKLLIERGILTGDSMITCTVASYESEIERTAAKILTNDGQPLTPDEIGHEIARLSETETLEAIAGAMGKKLDYVKQMHQTWTRLSEGAKKIIQDGKVGISLAHLISNKQGNDNLVNLSIQLAAAAKEKVKETGQTVSDSVLAEAVNLTTNNVVKGAQTGQPMSGQGIGADLLANILKVKGAKAAGTAAKREAMNAEPSKQVEMKRQTFETYVNQLLQAMEGAAKYKQVQAVLESILLSYSTGNGVQEALEAMYLTGNKTKKAA
jgi:hypothetical protein